MGKVNRCNRCGTVIRNNRAFCPSCGLDLTAVRLPADPAVAAVEQPVALAAQAQAQAAAPPRRPVNRGICALCMESVPEEQLVEQEGQRLCGKCAETMKNKAARKGGPALPPEKPDQA